MFRIIAQPALRIAAIGLLLSGLSLGGAGAVIAETHEEHPAPNATQGQLLQTQEIDVTGDGKADTVSLLGTKMDQSSPYYAKLFIIVSRPGQNQVVVPLEGGYNPRIMFCDFNGDKLPEVFISAEAGGSGGLSYHYLYSFKDNVPTAFPLPNPLGVKAAFKNNYVAKLIIEETKKSYKLDLKDKKADYDKFGLYKNGKLIKPIIVDVHPYGLLQPIDMEQDTVCELRGVQRITGIANADTIGYANSIWKWQDGKWTLKGSSISKTLQPNRTADH